MFCEYMIGDESKKCTYKYKYTCDGKKYCMIHKLIVERNKYKTNDKKNLCHECNKQSACLIDRLYKCATHFNNYYKSHYLDKEEPYVQPKATKPKAEPKATKPEPKPKATKPKATKPEPKPKATKPEPKPKATKPKAEPKATKPKATKPKAEPKAKATKSKLSPEPEPEPVNGTFTLLEELELLTTINEISYNCSSYRINERSMEELKKNKKKIMKILLKIHPDKNNTFVRVEPVSETKKILLILSAVNEHIRLKD